MKSKTLLIFIVFLVVIAINAHAQKKKQTSLPVEKSQTTTPTEGQAVPVKPAPNEQAQHYFKKYAMAMRWNDDQVAKDALYDMIVENPKNDSLIFALAYLYYENQQYAPTMLVAQELLARDAKNLGYLELSGVSFENLGLLDKALQNFESIYLLSNNTMALYKVAFLQYDLKRFNEALNNVDILLGKPDIETLQAGFNDGQNKPKDYPLKLAVMNLKGLILEGNNDKDGAKKIYGDILKLSPDFQPAKLNLEKLK